jgi:hypothetical protein
MRGVGGRGERRVGVGQITAHGDPYSSFSLSFFPLCVQRGFDEKILLSAVQYTQDLKKSRFPEPNPLPLVLVMDLPALPQIMDQISIKTPNPKCRLFLKVDQYLAAGVYLSEAPVHSPSPVTHCMNTCTTVLIHTGNVGGGGGLVEPVRSLAGRYLRSSQEESKILT